jgi:glycosyltransferase involved in cell wall biosynthesis
MRALALVDAPGHVCCRYRIRAFEPALAAAGWSLTTEGIASNPLARLRQFRRAAAFDAVLLQRKLLPGWQWGVLRRCSRRLVYDFDDAVLYRDSYDRRGPHCRRRASRFARTIRQADLVLAGNDFLANCARGAGAGPDRVRVLPTCVATDRYVPAPPRPDGPAQLVWVGSSSTLQGLERRRSLLERLGREVPGLRLRLICDRFPRFGPLEVVAVPWSEAGEAAAIAAGDVGISLLPDDLWSRGKCGLKVLQYQAAALPVVADPVGVHTRMIRPGVEGFLPESSDAWVEAVRSLAADPDLRRRMGRAARAAVEAGYAVAAWAPAFVAAVAGQAPPPAPKFGGRDLKSQISNFRIFNPEANPAGEAGA